MAACASNSDEYVLGERTEDPKVLHQSVMLVLHMQPPANPIRLSDRMAIDMLYRYEKIKI